MKKSEAVANKPESSESLVKRIAQSVTPIVQRALKLVIKSDEDYQLASGFLKTVKGFLQDIDDGEIGKVDRATKEARKSALDLRKRAEEPLLKAEAILKPKIAEYIRAEQMRKVREDRERADAIRKAAEEKAREEAEARRLEAASKLVEQDKYDEAAELVQEEVVIAPVNERVIAAQVRAEVRQVVKVEGVTIKTNYSAKVVDIQALLSAVADGKASIQTIQANMVYLNVQARSAKSTEKLGIPGVEVVSEDVVASGR